MTRGFRTPHRWECLTVHGEGLSIQSSIRDFNFSVVVVVVGVVGDVGVGGEWRVAGWLWRWWVGGWVGVREEERAEGGPQTEQRPLHLHPLSQADFFLWLEQGGKIYLCFVKPRRRGKASPAGDQPHCGSMCFGVLTSTGFLCALLRSKGAFVFSWSVCARKLHEDWTQQRILVAQSHACSCSTSIGHGENLTIMQSSFFECFL